jgi:hypothetical protein
VNPLLALLEQAALRGHTLLPKDMAELLVVERGGTVEDTLQALRVGDVLEVQWQGATAFALTRLAEAEEFAADGLLALVTENRLAVVVGPTSAGREQALRGALSDDHARRLLQNTHLMGIEQISQLVEDLPEDVFLALGINPAMPLAPVPGAVAVDLAHSNACPVLVVPVARSSKAVSNPVHGPAQVAAEVSAGNYPGVVGVSDHALVEVAVGDVAEAVVRVRQLVTDSIPRTFGVPADAIVVLTRAVEGPLGVSGLQALLPEVAVTLLTTYLEPHDAAVVVLAGPLPLTRAELYAALLAGRRHVSLVFLHSDPLVDALSRSESPRRTRLAELLRNGG